MNAPCYGCENRQVGCHTKCEMYHDFCKINEKRKSAQLAETIADGYQAESVIRVKKQQKRRKRR